MLDDAEEENGLRLCENLRGVIFYGAPHNVRSVYYFQSLSLSKASNLLGVPMGRRLSNYSSFYRPASFDLSTKYRPTGSSVSVPQQFRAPPRAESFFLWENTDTISESPRE
jgi:hypothetical protein